MNGEHLRKASAMGLRAKRHDLLPPSETLNPGPGSPREWPVRPRAGAVPRLVPHYHHPPAPPGALGTHGVQPCTASTSSVLEPRAWHGYSAESRLRTRLPNTHRPQAQPKTLLVASGGEEEPVAVLAAGWGVGCSEPSSGR